ncbi:hypothetical protein [Candidatus Sororendozoicomonas aggregata]|uniref:hypothetical protein n=1 Tax=Candidatus Sororendozoicomonas aggregata TaxID=3073239 RepID=UPI002ED6954D
MVSSTTLFLLLALALLDSFIISAFSMLKTKHSFLLFLLMKCPDPADHAPAPRFLPGTSSDLMNTALFSFSGTAWQTAQKKINNNVSAGNLHQNTYG